MSEIQIEKPNTSPGIQPQAQERHISSEYEQLLREHFTDPIVDETIHGLRSAEIPNSDGQEIKYVRFNEGLGRKPIVYVNGFVEGIPDKVPFAAALAEIGNDVILPDQNRSNTPKDPSTSQNNATREQAINILAVIEAEGLLGADIDFVTHSYGSLVVEEMHKIAQERKLTTFDNSKVIMLAPTGFSEENYPKLGMKTIASVLSDGSKKNPKDIPYLFEMRKANFKNFTANILRSIREGRRIRKDKVDHKRLTGIGSKLSQLAIVTYSEDKLYPNKDIQEEATKAVANGASWSVPISQEERIDPTSSKPNATHNYEQFNPERVAALVDELLRQ